MKDFETLCTENYNRIYKYIFAMTGNKESSEDLIQDVFTVAFEKGEAFLHHENPPAFLYRTARNLTLTHLKRQARYTAEYLDELTENGEGDLFDKLARDRDRQIDETVYVGQVIGRLNDKGEALYTQRYLGGRPIGEIAAEQGISEQALRMRLVRLRREIRRFVSELKLDEI